MGKSRKVQNKSEADNIRHPGPWSGAFLILAALAGLGICLYLYSFHIALLMGEIKSGLLCGSENGLGCNSVLSSPYSSLLGFPLASWGAIFFSALALLGGGSLIFRRDCGQAFLRLGHRHHSYPFGPPKGRASVGPPSAIWISTTTG